jgi:hypothetical protein
MLALATALAWSPGALGKVGPSEVVFPGQRLPILFSHKMHLKMKLACDFCHDRAETSTRSSDQLTPSEEPCRACHKIERDKPEKEAIPEARCDGCHVYPPGSDVQRPPPVEVPPPNLKFNHKVHADRRIPCERCHGTMDQVKLATREELPRMPLCLGCHNQVALANRAPAKCSTCHLTAEDGTLETHFATGLLVPSGTLKGDAHGPNFVREHSSVGKDLAYCETCHRREMCIACHNGVVKPLSFHGNDYVSIHAIDARKWSMNCNGCHREQTFCLGCHERVGVVDRQTAAAPNAGDVARPARRFHPPYDKWVLPPRTPDHHAWQAERNMRQCVSCHRQETCLECHSTPGGPRGAGAAFNANPHPPGFAGSRACSAMASRNGRVCLKCHAPGDAQLSCH